MGTDTDAIGRPYVAASRLRTILGETEATLRGIYGDRFLGLVLFGSHARGTAASGSDIDLVLLLGDCEGVRERRHYSAAIADLSLRHDTVISVVPMGIDEYRSGKTPFLLNVRKEGVSL
ncbi:MAG: nucleotidyltransferase domain-containing protein [Clostridia bacterium]|nr:nucleotidyltransferase domain-containing protein [Clostridia bacterium]